MKFVESLKHVGRKSFVFSFLLSLLLATGAWADSRVDTLINSAWKFNRADVANAQLPSFNDSAWSTVDVPHTWNALDGENGGNDYYRGIGWYRKYCTIGAENSGKRVYLFFESVGISADVYCNGTLVGSHLGAYAAFCFDITSVVTFGTDNLIAVKANNASSLNVAPLSGDFTQWGGMCRNVHLIITNPVHITLLDYASPGVYLTPTSVSSTSSALGVKTLIRNAGATAKDVTVTATIRDANDITVGTPLVLTQTVAAGATTNFVQNTTVANPHLWDGRADPYLYNVLVEVAADGGVVDTMEQPLGFRYYTVNSNTGFFLNGHYLDLHGAAIHEDRDHKGRAISDADRTQDIQIMLDMGCTWLRLAHYQHAEKIYDLADAAGMILSTEIPLVNSIQSTQAFSDNCQSQLKELIRQNYNHPSVLFWGLFNELGGSPETLLTLLNTLAHQEDPTRLTTAAANTSNTAPMTYISDVIGYNRYDGWYNGAATDFAGWATTIHAARGSDEIGVTEYGCGASINQHQENPPEPANAGPFHPEEYQTYFHEVYWKAMKTRPYLWCKTIWNGFDFGVDSRNEGDRAGINDKGMVLRDRTVKKDAYFWYQSNWTSAPMVYITSRRFTPRTATPTYVKVYSNCDNVELFINGVSKGVLTSTDHIYQWNSGLTFIGGSNEIKAIGRVGATEYTDICNWSLGTTLPIVAITSPAEGALLPAGNIVIQATASETGGTISTVEFYNGSTLLGADTTSPYSFTWTSVASGCYTIKAKAIDSGGASTTVSVNITVGTGCSQPTPLAMQILAVTASGFQPGNTPENTIDGNMTTRWANDGVGSWLKYDLGFARELQGVKIAFYNGNSRHYNFNIDVSNDNSTWTPALTGGVSGGTTAGFEEFDFTAVSARYLRITGNGYVGGTWNSYFEVGMVGPLLCSDVLACGLRLNADLSGSAGVPDCSVDTYDLAVIAANWLQNAPTGDLTGPAGVPDSHVDLYDLAAMAAEWMQCNIPDDPACN
jgi:beta-galactosidase